MDANNLKYFVAVAKYGSINHAAKNMFISQPQLSHIIKSLEEETGLILFQRTNQGTRLTPDGEAFLHHCEIILNEMDNLRHFVSSAREDRGRMSVSMTRFSHTAECFNEICRRHQNLERLTYMLKEEAPMDVIDDVADGMTNVGVLHFSSKDADLMKRNLETKKLDFTPLATFRPYVCISEKHPVLNRQNRSGIDLRDLSEYGFVRYLGQYEDFIYHIATQGGLIDLNDSQKIIYVNDRQEQMRLISATTFYTIGISEFRRQNSLYGVISVPLTGCTEQLRFGIVRKHGKNVTAIEQEFIDEVIRRYKEIQAGEPEKTPEPQTAGTDGK